MSPQKPVPAAKPISPLRQIPRLLKHSHSATESSAVIHTNGHNIYEISNCKTNANNNNDLFDDAKTILENGHANCNNRDTVSMKNSLNVLKSSNFI